MSARILIVEDEEPLTMLLRYNFEAEVLHSLSGRAS
jgi:DNA-binding response OmpR family regulator